MSRKPADHPALLDQGFAKSISESADAWKVDIIAR
jgi:hypothetical protein